MIYCRSHKHTQPCALGITFSQKDNSDNQKNIWWSQYSAKRAATKAIIWILHITTTPSSKTYKRSQMCIFKRKRDPRSCVVYFFLLKNANPTCYSWRWLVLSISEVNNFPSKQLNLKNRQKWRGNASAQFALKQFIQLKICSDCVAIISYIRNCLISPLV